MAHRIPNRRSNGRYTRGSLETSFGITPNICPHCGGFNPSKVGAPKPATCNHCGKPLDREARQSTQSDPQVTKD